MTQIPLSSSSPYACPGCESGDVDGCNTDSGSYRVDFAAILDPFCHLAPLFQYLWRRKVLLRFNFCEGWSYVPAKSLDPVLRVAALVEEGPWVGVGGVEKEWRGTIDGDLREFAQIVSTPVKRNLNRGDFMADQGGGWRARRDLGFEVGIRVNGLGDMVAMVGWGGGGQW